MQLTITAKKDSDELVKMTREGNKRERLPARFARPPAYPAAVTHRNTSKQRATKRAACVANAKRAVNICTSQKTRPKSTAEYATGAGTWANGAALVPDRTTTAWGSASSSQLRRTAGPSQDEPGGGGLENQCKGLELDLLQLKRLRCLQRSDLSAETWTRRKRKMWSQPPWRNSNTRHCCV